MYLILDKQKIIWQDSSSKNEFVYMRFFFGLLFCFYTLFIFAEDSPEDNIVLSTPEQIATLYAESSYLIGGLISPLSGQLALRETDLVVKGAQSLNLSHLYIPPSIPSSFPQHKKRQAEWNNFYLAQHLRSSYKGWTYLPHLRLQYFSGSSQIRLSDPSGATLDFRLSGNDAYLISKPYAISNASGDVPSGKNDPRNTRIVCDRANGTIKVSSPDGTTRLYGNSYRNSSGSTIFLLLKEILPNGKVLLYLYNKTQLLSIESKDPKESFTYAKVTIENGLNLSGGSIVFRSPSGINTQYSHVRRSLPAKLKENPFTGQSVKKFEWNPILPALLTGVSSPFFRKETLSYDHNFLLTGYSGKDNLFTCSYGSYGPKNKHFKVQTLSFPIGPNETFQPVYTFSYDPPVPGQRSGYTIVNHPDGTFIRYDFSENLLMTSIKCFDKKRVLKKQKTFVWADQHYLYSIEIKDENGLIIHRKTFEYDAFGNPIVETLHGNLTGKGQDETYTTKRGFSQDGRNLLLKEVTEEGKTTTWEYLPETNLVTAKLIKDQDKILLREFYDYDDCHNLIRMTLDDGCGNDPADLSEVGQRTIKEYHLRQQNPYLHLPEWIEERYWDQGEEKLLRRTHLVYDACGNVKEEHVYGSDGAFAYTILRSYNERGDILSETNALGDQISYDYDEKGLRIYKNSFSERLHTTFSYDKQGRLREKEEKGEGLKHVHSYEYDFFDRLSAKIDPFENRTSYEYDFITDQVTKSTFPCIESIEGASAVVQTHASYDVLGNRLTQTDSNRNVTTYEYNAYGSPLYMIHPDDSKEYYRYTKGGQLASHTDSDGLTIRYERDVLGRVLVKKYLDRSGEEVAEETFSYNGFNLLAHTNKEGRTKEYFYDGVGRKVCEEFCGRETGFSYDSLGFLEKVIYENGHNTLTITYTRDHLGQILKKEKSGPFGTILHKTTYSYDADGNQTILTRFINHQESAESFDYDSIGRLITHTDPFGYVTTKTYKEDYVNAIGQQVLQLIVTDPLQTSKVRTYDAFGKISKEKTLAPHGQTVAHHQNTYDPSGNLTYRKDDVYHGFNHVDTQVIQHTYNCRGRLASTTRGYGSRDPRVTSYDYTSTGKLATKTNPDQISLTYEYDDLGFLASITSSDGQIDHSFESDREGHLLAAIDENFKLAVEREIDPFGNVIQEALPNGLTVEKDYDALDRVTAVKFQNMGEVHYSYDPLFLKQITRCFPGGAALYSHQYESYDLNGNTLSERLIYNLGSISHEWDRKGRRTGVNSSYLREAASYDPCNNLLSKILDNQGYEYAYDALYQLASEKGEGLLTSHEYDSTQNIVKKNHQIADINPLNELLSIGETECAYDLNGNQILKQSEQGELEFTYDPLNRLTSASGKGFVVSFSYDPLGRRLSKKVEKRSSFGTSETVEHYLYDGEEEIGAVTNRGKLKNFKVLGASSYQNVRQPVAVELDGQVFLPILDMQGNVSKLVDPYKNMYAAYHYSAFGEEQNTPEQSNPWRYFSKRIDPETGLIYFGKRYYDPQIARWLTTDPAGFTDSVNLYQYAFNNPFKYYDPHGENLLGFLGGIAQILAGGAIMASGVAIEIATFGGYTFALGFHESAGLALMASGCTMAMHHARDLSMSNERPRNPSMDWDIFKSKDVYTPDRDLPKDKDGNKIPDTDAPHTQLGTKEGSKGKYPQAREFDAEGNPVKDIDFTDHGRPSNHPNPHQHIYNENPTGGTESRDKNAEPVPGWRY